MNILICFSAYFSAVVKVIYNLLYYQVVLQISCNLSQAERSALLTKTLIGKVAIGKHVPHSLETTLGIVIGYFNNSKIYGDESSTSESSARRIFRILGLFELEFPAWNVQFAGKTLNLELMVCFFNNFFKIISVIFYFQFF